MDGGEIASSASNLGDAGTVILNVNELEILNNGKVRSRSIGTLNFGLEQDGNAGAIIVQGLMSTDEFQTKAKTITLNQSEVSIEAATTGTGNFIEIQADTSIDLTGSDISANVNNGVGEETSNIQLVAPTITMFGGSIVAQTQGTRPAGDITLQADVLTADSPAGQAPATIASSSIGGAIGKAGTVTLEGVGSTGTNLIKANIILLSNTAIETESQNTGEGGSIAIVADNRIDLTNTTISATVNNGAEMENSDIEVGAPLLNVTGGIIEAQTLGSRPAGDIRLQAENLTVTSQVGQEPATITSSSVGSATGAAGTVSIEGVGSTNDNPIKSTTVTLTDSVVRTESESTGAGGSIGLGAENEISLENTIISGTVKDAKDKPSEGSSDVTLIASTLTMTGGRVEAQTAGSRDAGDINFNVETLEITEGGFVSSSSDASATGAAGTVTVQGLGGESTSAGTIAITNSEVSTKATGDGAGGAIDLAANLLDLSAGSVSAAVEGGSQPGGNIELKGGQRILIRDNTIVSASNTGTGPAGDIQIRGTDTGSAIKEENGNSIPLVNEIRLENSQVTTNSNSATGGNISLNADQLIHVIDSEITSEIGAGTAGGNIDFDPQFIVLQGNTRVSTAATSAVSGDGGTIQLGRPGDNLFVAPTAILDVSSQSGQSGTLAVGATTQSLSEEVPRPDVAIIDPQNFLPVRCASQQGGSFSSIVEDGLDVLPPEPGDFFPSPLPSFDGAEDNRSTRQSSISIDPQRFGFSTTQEGSDVSNQIALSSSLLGCSF